MDAKFKLNYHAYKMLWGILFCVPGVVFFSVFYVYPIFRAMQISLFRWDILRDPQFIGLRNYVQMFICVHESYISC